MINPKIHKKLLLLFANFSFSLPIKSAGNDDENFTIQLDSPLIYLIYFIQITVKSFGEFRHCYFDATRLDDIQTHIYIYDIYMFMLTCPLIISITDLSFCNESKYSWRDKTIITSHSAFIMLIICYLSEENLKPLTYLHDDTMRCCYTFFPVRHILLLLTPYYTVTRLSSHLVD